jgi:hypothetical protein
LGVGAGDTITAKEASDIANGPNPDEVFIMRNCPRVFANAKEKFKKRLNP